MAEQGSGKVILVLSQRDKEHPEAGGAEKYVHNALKALAKTYNVIHLGMTFRGAEDNKIIDGIHYIRKGHNQFTVILQGRKLYRKYKDNIEIVIDHATNHQFFTFLWARDKRVYLTHQLGLNIWPYYYGVWGHVLKFLEERLVRRSKGTAITVSCSTEQDLLDRGFSDVHICREGNDKVLDKLPEVEIKEDYLLYVGRLLPYKRVEDVILLGHALGRKVKIMGRGPDKYIKHLISLVKENKIDCEFTGYLSYEDKLDTMMKAYMLVLPSIREGWGLVITEAATLGTPSIVYNVPGVVDAVNQGKAGFIAPEVDYMSMKNVIEEMTPEKYNHIRKEAFEFSKQFTWEETSKQFKNTIEGIIESRR